MPLVSFWMPEICAPNLDCDVLTQPETHAHVAAESTDHRIARTSSSPSSTSVHRSRLLSVARARQLGIQASEGVVQRLCGALQRLCEAVLYAG
eukprot:7383688-Prymnesium_polylepis.1